MQHFLVRIRIPDREWQRFCTDTEVKTGGNYSPGEALEDMLTLRIKAVTGACEATIVDQLEVQDEG